MGNRNGTASSDRDDEDQILEPAALVQIGSDSGLLARPVTHDFIDLASAERVEVVVDFSRYQHGTRVRLVNRLGSETTAEVMRFDVVGTDRSDDSTIPDRLSTNLPAAPRP